VNLDAPEEFTVSVPLMNLNIRFDLNLCGDGLVELCTFCTDDLH
jgi:hypothetical protein